jgi:hypothetical protein
VNDRRSWLRIAVAAVLGGAAFALISVLEVLGSTVIGLGGILSIFVWIAIGLYLRAGPLAAAGVGAWSGLVGVAISFVLVQRQPIPPIAIDGSRIAFVTTQSFLIWPVLGALVCSASDLTHRLTAGKGCLALGGIAVAAAIAAFVTAIGLH